MSQLQQLSSSQVSPEVPINENFETLEHQAVYGKDHTTTAGLTWGYVGGRWGGFSITAGTLTLTNTAANYLVVAMATGVISTSTTTTNWNDSDNYLRVYKVTTASSVVTAVEDHRAGPGGVHGGGANTGAGAALTDVNVWSKNQSVAPSALTDGATISVDASLSNNFKVTLEGNRTLANPTNLSDGMVLNFRIKQDATGTRTLAYGSKYKWPGGTAFVLSTAAGAVDMISCYYDSTDDVLECVGQAGFA
jgi:hypothetical protein